uniref:Uncharacterized protein n=1 Tax=Anguilla anguilla TaxID=7936 RepID=A0A0E9PFD4_ANGAN
MCLCAVLFCVKKFKNTLLLDGKTLEHRSHCNQCCDISIRMFS